MSIVTRFAPSPTGFLHLGHAYAALTAWRRAREAGGSFLLRLEDIDTTRCHQRYADAIKEDLRWLGLDWDGEVRVQSSHFHQYQAALHSLPSDLLYPCFCSRSDIAAATAAPHATTATYPGTCRRLSPRHQSERIEAGLPFATRLNMQAALAYVAGPLHYVEEGEGTVLCDPAPFGDVILARRDIPASYHLCVTHDDSLQGVTLVTRASDLRSATHLHRLLQALLGYATPTYAHHPMLTDASGNRLSKRDGAPSLRALRAQGLSPAQVRDMAAPP
jgi:glutamyl-Q tRNA(Asp) synthetase